MHSHPRCAAGSVHPLPRAGPYPPHREGRCPRSASRSERAPLWMPSTSIEWTETVLGPCAPAEACVIPVVPKVITRSMITIAADVMHAIAAGSCGVFRISSSGLKIPGTIVPQQYTELCPPSPTTTSISRSSSHRPSACAQLVTVPRKWTLPALIVPSAIEVLEPFQMAAIEHAEEVLVAIAIKIGTLRLGGSTKGYIECPGSELGGGSTPATQRSRKSAGYRAGVLTWVTAPRSLESSCSGGQKYGDRKEGCPRRWLGIRTAQVQSTGIRASFVNNRSFSASAM